MTDAAPKPWQARAQIAPRDAPHLVVLVEDDRGDAVLFEAAISEVDPELEVQCVTTVAAILEIAFDEDVSCVVLDLGLPGMTGFQALDRLVKVVPTVAVVVLTGWGDAQAGAEALARGAQDYLIKGEVDGATIARSIRFAVERKRSQSAATELVEARVREQEQHRLERALVVDPAVQRPDVTWSHRYIAARAGMVSGDFFDGVERADGTLRFVIGDVAGHGSDAAALGVGLRAAWRSLVLASRDDASLLGHLEEFLVMERTRGDEFATVCDLTISSDLSSICVRNAGHPPPILAGVGPLEDPTGRSPLGIDLHSSSTPGEPGATHTLPESWSLAVYTDGLFEVRGGSGVILGGEEVPAAVERATADGAIDADALIEAFADQTADGWRDDVAVLVISRPAVPGASP